MEVPGYGKTMWQVWGRLGHMKEILDKLRGASWCDCSLWFLGWTEEEHKILGKQVFQDGKPITVGTEAPDISSLGIKSRFPLSKQESAMGGLWGLWPKSEEVRISGGRKHCHLARNQCSAYCNQLSSTCVLPDRSSRFSHPGRKKNDEQERNNARWQKWTKVQPAGSNHVPNASRN